MCYRCMPDMATGSLCNMMSQYTKIMCQNESSTCYNSTITTSLGKSFVLGCVDLPVSKDNPLHTALYSLSEGGGGYSPIWPTRGCAVGRHCFLPLCPKHGI